MACRVAIKGIAQRAFPAFSPKGFTYTIAVPAPYHRRTSAAAPSDFIAKSEGAATLVLSWYDPGTAMVACSLGHEAAHLVWVSGELLGWSQGVSRGTLARDWDMRTLLMGTACLRVLAGERRDELLTGLEGI